MTNAVTIGIFDGVHKGHQALLQAAQATGLSALALTFDPHPATLFSPARVPLLLGTVEERDALLRAHGVDTVVIQPFDRAFAALTPDDFVREVLLDGLNAGAIIVGEDFRFGCDRRGDISALRQAGDRHDFKVIVVPPVFLDGTPVRSTTIRQLLSGGQTEAAARLLGRPYSLSGVVVRGRQLGRQLGFPTANLAIPAGQLIPAPGVYAGRVGECLAAISVGVNITVDPDAAPTVEAYLLDFFGDLYDQHLTFQFEKFLRPMQKFDGLDTLISAIRADVETVRTTLA
ncbi:MAG: bifunctional riboflavin kinase/FAD synthetase [Armatimonas sp.]